MARALQGNVPLRKQDTRYFKKVENVVDYFSPSKNEITESVITQKLFHTILVHSKPFTEKIGTCY